AAPRNEVLATAVRASAFEPLKAVYQLRDKQERTTRLRQVYAEVRAKLAEHAAARGDEAPDTVEVENMLFALESEIVRGQILNGEPRIDGRDTRTVRPISI